MTAGEHLRSIPGSLLGAAHAELIKLRTLRFTWFAALASLLLAAMFAAVVAASIAASVANGYDLTASSAAIAADAVTFGQLPVLMIAITLATSEHGTGAIRLSLRGTPLRGQLLLAKGCVMAATAFALGVLVALSGVTTALLMIGDTDTATGAEIARTTIGVGVYLGSVSLLLVGIGTIVRSTIVSILVALLLLLAGPVLTQVSSADWLQTAQTYLPSTAGAVLMSPDGGDYSAGVAMMIMVCWVLLSQLGGYVVMWLRDP
jgi:ABC-2 type transport system permease protein